MNKRRRVSREEVLENIFGDSRGLQNSIVFNPNLRFAPGSVGDQPQSFILMFAERMDLPTGPKRRPEAIRNLETLFANLIVVGTKDRKGYLSFSQSPNSYGKNGKFSPLTSGIITIVKELERQGYLFKYNGYKGNFEGRLARLKGRAKFCQLLETQLTTEPAIHARPDELIQLRKKEGKDKKTIPRHIWRRQNSKELNQDLDALETLCASFNDLISHHEISYTDANGREKMLYPYLYRVFSEHFESGGRYYTGYGGHQNLPKAERATILIDNEPTVELDFGGLHMRMLYHMAGRNYPFDHDPYLAVLEAINYPFDLADDGKPANPQIRLVRDDMKVMLLHS